MNKENITVNVNTDGGKKKKKGLTVLIVMALLGGLVWLAYNQINKEKVPPTPQAILRHWEDSVKKSYEVLLQRKDDTIRMSQQREAKWVDSIVMLHGRYDGNVNAIQNIKSHTDEKVKRINNLSTDDLARFLTNRYSKKS